MDEVGTVLIKVFDGIVRKLKDVRYIPQMKKNLISIRALEAQVLDFFLVETGLSRCSKALWKC